MADDAFAVVCSDSIIKNPRGQSLFVVRYDPPSKTTTVARLFFHHGLGDHCGRYGKVFRRMAAAGVIVHSMDAHNHGKSDSMAPNDRAFIASFDHFVDDYALLIDSVRTEIEGTDATRLPSFVGGHSTGGLISAWLVLRPGQQARWAGLLLHSPVLDVQWNVSLTIQSYIGRLLGWLMPRARVVAAVKVEDISPDPAVRDEYLKDPLATKGAVCAGTACVILDAFVAIGPRAKDFTLPIYCGFGTLDRITSLPAAKRWLARVGSTDATLKEFEGGYHELLMGPEWADASDTMVAWMRERAKQ
ncbi:hypothetical protein FOA52_013011 [Chlamydomonas sp. UWO 241]|nr:hypothetical protein FOA52_013011 [Chlamydomonas sp. UWO 241]